MAHTGASHLLCYLPGTEKGYFRFCFFAKGTRLNVRKRSSKVKAAAPTGRVAWFVWFDLIEAGRLETRHLVSYIEGALRSGWIFRSAISAIGCYGEVV